jgi:hypothetical protein
VQLGPTGETESSEVLRGKIHSQAQLTYAGVTRELEGKGKIDTDEHKKPVPAAVRSQLGIFQELGEKRMAIAKERGVVSPDRHELRIGMDDGRFFLKDTKDGTASKLNAEISVLANVAGAEQMCTSVIPGLKVPAIFRNHPEPAGSAYRALRRQTDRIIDENGLPPTWKQGRAEPLSMWVDRLKTLPKNDREERLGHVLQTAAVRVNVASEYGREPDGHSGLKVEAYGRFTAPMREQVGLVSHAVLFAKAALEGAYTGAGLTPAQGLKLWDHLLLATLLPPDKIPAAHKELAQKTLALHDAATDEARAAIGKELAALADTAPPVTDETKRQTEDVMQRTLKAGNSSRMRQRQVDTAGLKLLFDDLFHADLGGDPQGNPHAPIRAGTIVAVTPGRVYVQLQDPYVELRLGLEDLKRHCPDANFHLVDDGCALATEDGKGGAVARLFVGADILVQATHHDGDRLRFTIVE